MPDNREETTELKDVDVQFISLVHRGANNQRFEIFKSQDYEPEGEEVDDVSEENQQLTENEQGLIGHIKKWFVKNGIIKGDEVEKQVSPISWQVDYDRALEEVQTREGMERIEFAFDLLKDTVWNIFHLDEEVNDPVQAVRDAVESFSEHIINIINDRPQEVQKWVEEVKKQKEGGTTDMGEVNQETLEELTKGITSLNDKIEGLSNRLDEVEKEDQNPEGNEPEEGEEVEKSGEEGQEGSEEEEDTIEKSVQELTDTVKKAVKKLDNLEDRVETVEKARDISNDPGDDDVKKGDDDGGWGSIVQ